MKNSEEQDDLWQLLGKAKKNEVSPFFAANVLRQVRASRQEKPGILSWWRIQWRVASLAGVAALLLAVNAMTLFVPQKTAPIVAKAVPVATAPAEALQIAANKVDDEEVITHLDELLAYEENNLWTEDSSK